MGVVSQDTIRSQRAHVLLVRPRRIAVGLLALNTSLCMPPVITTWCSVLSDNCSACGCSEGIIIEWFDREQSLPYEITMPTQNKDTTTCVATIPPPHSYGVLICPEAERSPALLIVSVLQSASPPTPGMLVTTVQCLRYLGLYLAHGD